MDSSGVIEFDEFLKVIEKQKSVRVDDEDERVTLAAFVALGGNVILVKLKSA